MYTSRQCLLCGKTCNSGKICPRCKKSLSFLEGKRCRICSAPLLSEEETCLRCRKRNFSFIENFSLFSYEDSIRELIYQYKFNNEKSLAPLFAEFFYTRYLSHIIFSENTVVPVPSRKVVIKERGWDHIESITLLLQKRYMIPVLFCLERQGNRSQKSLDFEGRLHNLQGKINLTTKKNLPEKVILLDDVFTTGATIEQCTQKLREGGVKEVRSLTLALD